MLLDPDPLLADAPAVLDDPLVEPPLDPLAGLVPEEPDALPLPFVAAPRSCEPDFSEPDFSEPALSALPSEGPDEPFLPERLSVR